MPSKLTNGQSSGIRKFIRDNYNSNRESLSSEMVEITKAEPVYPNQKTLSILKATLERVSMNSIKDQLDPAKLKS
jgi:hypothetical protein